MGKCKHIHAVYRELEVGEFRDKCLVILENTDKEGRSGRQR